MRACLAAGNLLLLLVHTAQSGAFDDVKLPSGKVLTEAIVRVPKQWQYELFPEETPLFISKYPNGEIQGIYAYAFAKLHGAAAVLHEGGGLARLARYHEGQVDGQLRHWEKQQPKKQGEPKQQAACMEFFGQYVRGRKDGLVCVFRERSPWLIQDWEKGRLVREYLVKPVGGKPALVSWDELKPADPDLPEAVFAERMELIKDFTTAQRRLKSLETQLRKSETETKRQLAAWYRDEDRRIKQQRAAEHSLHVRQNIAERINARRAATAALMEVQRAAWAERTLQ